MSESSGWGPQRSTHVVGPLARDASPSLLVALLHRHSLLLRGALRLGPRSLTSLASRGALASRRLRLRCGVLRLGGSLLSGQGGHVRLLRRKRVLQLPKLRAPRQRALLRVRHKARAGLQALHRASEGAGVSSGAGAATPRPLLG